MEDAKLSLVASLPPEILDQILFHRFRGSKRTDDSSRKGLALVCRSWSETVKRHLFRRIKVHSVAKLQELGRIETSFGRCVQSLSISIHEAPHRIWTVEDFNLVMEKLPNVTSLTISLSRNSPSRTASYGGMISLPNLKELTLRSQDNDPSYSSYRQILSVTPNITSLILESGDYTRSLPPTPRPDIPPIHLLSLVRLHLDSATLSEAFNGWELLSSETLAHITELGYVLYDFESGDYAARVCPNVTTLWLPLAAGTPEDHHFLGAFPKLDTLVLSSPLLRHNHGSIVEKSTLSTLKLWRFSDHEHPPGGYKWLESALDTHFRESAIKRVEIEDAEALFVAKERISRRGIELFLDGVKYVRDDRAWAEYIAVE